jgi:uncharacterized membrane protein
MSWYPKEERRLFVWGPGGWTAVGVIAALWIWTPGSGGELLAPALTAGVLALALAEIWRYRARMRPADERAVLVVQSQSFSGLAVVAVGAAVGAVGHQLGLDPPEITLADARVVWTVCLMIVTAAAAQLITSTRRLVTEGQIAHAQFVASERDARTAELSALRQKLEPALVLGALDAIAQRAERDPADAERAVEQLSEYLRQSLQAPSALEVTLGEDKARADEFLAILALAGVHAPIEWAIDADAAAVTIPSGTLHTFLHYAIERCRRDSEREATITVRAYCHAARFYLIVTDTAAPDPPLLRESDELSALRSRLGAPPQRRVRVISHIALEVDGTTRGTTQTLSKVLEKAA